MAALALLAGCGGGGHHDDSIGQGEVTGLVVDGNGSPVRGATVSADGHQTVSDSAGRYVLSGVSAKDLNVKAQTTVDGTGYYGQNLGRVYRDESTPNVIVALYPSSQIVRLKGQVRGSDGHILSNVTLTARPTNGGLRTSAMAVTGNDGFYTLDGLAENVEYKVVASAQGYGDDSALVTFTTTDDRQQDLVVKNLTTAAPDAPTGLFAKAYTTPGDFSAKAQGSAIKRAAAYEGVRRLRDPQRAARLAKLKARDTSNGSPVSIDLTWNEYPLDPAVRPNGFIVYRNETPTLDNGVFLPDAQASLFSDSDVNLLVGTAYAYSLVAVSTGFDASTAVGRSAATAAVSAVPLDDLFLNDSVGRTVSWTAVAGATTYTVYVYADYPTLTATPVSTVTTTGTRATLDATATPSGATSYYLVVGSRTADPTTNIADAYTEIRAITP